MKKLALTLFVLCCAIQTYCSSQREIPTLHELAFEKLKDPLLNTMNDPRYCDFFKTIETYDRAGQLKKLVHNYGTTPSSLDWLASLFVKNVDNRHIFLCNAIKSNNGQLMQYVLSQEAETTIQADFHINLTNAASFYNADKVLESLIAAHVPIDNKEAGNDEKWTPLATAAKGNADKAAALLLARGADVNEPIYLRTNYSLYLNLKKSNSNQPLPTPSTSALHTAARYGADKVLPLLIHAGARINLINSEGKTPLHYAVMRAYKNNIFLSLLAAGADIKIKDNENITARDCTTNPKRLAMFDQAVIDIEHINTLLAQSKKTNLHFSKLQHYGKTPDHISKYFIIINSCNCEPQHD